MCMFTSLATLSTIQTVSELFVICTQKKKIEVILMALEVLLILKRG